MKTFFRKLSSPSKRVKEPTSVVDIPAQNLKVGITSPHQPKPSWAAHSRPLFPTFHEHLPHRLQATVTEALEVVSVVATTGVAPDLSANAQPSEVDEVSGSCQRQQTPRKASHRSLTSGTDGELLDASPVLVQSESHLLREFDEITCKLHKNAESWEERVSGIVQLEGLAKGNAPTRFAETFTKGVLALHDVLEPQVVDRRSQVSRQACHAIAFLMELCGPSLEALALSLQGSLLKAQVMSIHVIAEAADQAYKSIIRNCPNARLLPTLLPIARNDKNIKLRVAVAEYLAQVIREWDIAVYYKHKQLLEDTIMAACADASAEVRSIAREAFVQYHMRQPHAARAALHRLDDNELVLKNRLLAAIAQSCEPVETTDTLNRVPPRQSSQDQPESSLDKSVVSSTTGVKKALRVPKLMLSSLGEGIGHGTRVPLSGSISARSSRASRTAATSNSSRRPSSASAVPTPLSSRGASSPRPQKPSLGPKFLLQEGAGASRRSSARTALRVTDASPSGYVSKVECARKIPVITGGIGAAQRQQVVTEQLSQQLPMVGSTPAIAPAISATQAVTALMEANVMWDSKIDLYAALENCFENDNLEDLQGNTDLIFRTKDVLLCGVQDSHFKVANVALQATIAAMQSKGVGRIFENHLESLVAALFARVTDPKEQVRQLASMAVDVLHRTYNPEAITSSIVAVLNSAKAAKSKCALLQSWIALLESVVAVTNPRGQRHLAYTQPGRAMVAACVHLATNKRPDVRQTAMRALATAYSTGAAALVESSVVSLPSSPRDCLIRGLATALIPALGADATRENATCTQGTPPSRLQSPDKSPSPTARSGSAHSPQPLGTPRQLAACDNAISMYKTVPGICSANSLQDRPEWRSGISSPDTSDSDGDDDAEGEEGSPRIILPSSRMTCGSSPWVLSTLTTPPKSGTARTDVMKAPIASSEELFSHGGLDALACQLRSKPQVWCIGEAREAALRTQGDVRRNVTAALFDGLVVSLAGIGPAAAHELTTVLVQEHALQAFIEVLPLDPSVVSGDSAPVILKALLKATASKNGNVGVLAQQAAAMLVKSQDPVDAVSALVPHLPSPDAVPLFNGKAAIKAASVLRLLTQAIGTVTPVQLMAVLGMIMPSMCYCYSSPSAELRKAAAMCIVATYCSVGPDTIAAHLTSLSHAQKKLIEIYAERGGVL
jgi:hypothetical protein